jgi:hypothetical protein
MCTFRIEWPWVLAALYTEREIEISRSAETSGSITHRDPLIQSTTVFSRVLPDGEHERWLMVETSWKHEKGRQGKKNAKQVI